MVHRGDARWEMNNAGVEGKTGWPSNKDEKHGETHLSQVSAFSVSSLELQRVNALALQTSNSRATEQCSTEWGSPASSVSINYWSVFLNGPRNRPDPKPKDSWFWV